MFAFGVLIRNIYATNLRRSMQCSLTWSLTIRSVVQGSTSAIVDLPSLG